MSHPINFFSTEFLDDPYPYYRRMQSTAPVMPQLGFRGNDWILTRYSDIRSVLSSKAFVVDNVPVTVMQNGSASDQSDRARLSNNIRHWLFFIDPPLHTAMRTGVVRAFSKNRISGFQNETDEILNDLLIPFMGQKKLDVINDVAAPLTTRLMLRFLGIKAVNDQKISDWASRIFEVFQQPISTQRYAQLGSVVYELEKYLEQVLSARDQYLFSDGLLARLLAPNDPHVSIPKEQLLAWVTMLLSVGRDTTKNLIGNSLLALSESPDAWQQLSNDHSLLESAVTELARYDTPVQLIVRVAKETTQVGDQTINAGERAHLFLGAGLRDPDVFNQPNEIDFQRTGTGNLPFGAGPHYCLGAYIARLASRSVLQRLAKPGTHSPKWSSTTAVRQRSVHLRGFTCLPMQFSQVL